MQLTEQHLKRALNRVCLTYGGFMIAIVVVSMMAMMMVGLIMGVTSGFLDALDAGSGGGVDELLADADISDTITDALAESAPLAQLLAVALSTTIFFALRGTRLLTHDITLRRQTPRASFLLAMFGLALGVQFVMLVFNALTAPLLNQLDLSLTEAMDEGISELMVDPIGLLYVMLLGPLCEEIVFRGAILRALEPYGANFAIVASSLLFGLYHIILFQAVFAFLLGLILAYVAGRFSLKWAVVLHVANNTLATSSLFFTPLMGEEVFTMILIALFFVGFVFSLLFLVAKRRILTAQRLAGAPVVAHPFALLFTRPLFLVIVFLIMLLGVGYLFVG